MRDQLVPLPVHLVTSSAENALKEHKYCLICFNENYGTSSVPVAKFYFVHLILRFYEYSMHVEGLLVASLCLVIKLGNMFTI